MELIFAIIIGTPVCAFAAWHITRGEVQENGWMFIERQPRKGRKARR